MTLGFKGAIAGIKFALVLIAFSASELTDAFQIVRGVLPGWSTKVLVMEHSESLHSTKYLYAGLRHEAKIREGERARLAFTVSPTTTIC